mgnify:FL=1
MINGTKYTPQVWTPEEAHNVDLLIVSLKYGSLRGGIKGYSDDRRRKHNGHESDEWS